jgi:predicted nucleotidyltransferase
MVAKELLIDIRERLQAAYGSRFRGAVLYGSEARGEAGPDSDIDILVLLEGPVDIGADNRAGIAATYPLILRSGRVIDVAPVDVRAYDKGIVAMYRNAKQEGVRL